MEAPIIGLISIAIGLVGYFRGYTLFRILLPLIGGIVGYIVGTATAPADTGSTGIVIGLVVAVLLAVLAYTVWSVLVALGGGLLGFGAGVTLGTALHLSSGNGALLGVVLAIVAGVFFLKLKDPAIMFSTAFSGAGSLLYGLDLLAPAQLGFLGGNQGSATIILWLVLGCVGFIAQYRLFVGRQRYRFGAL